MADSMEMQKRYYEVLLEQYQTGPHLNRSKIKDCRHYLKLLEETGSAGKFMNAIKQTGNMVSTAKADATDRYKNASSVYEILGEQKKLEENNKRIEVISSSKTHAELSSRLEQFETETRLSFNENKAFTALGSVISTVFQLATDNPGSGHERRSAAVFKKYWEMLLEADPEATWEKINTYPPYRDRIIFTDRQMAVLEATFRRICNG